MNLFLTLLVVISSFETKDTTIHANPIIISGWYELADTAGVLINQRKGRPSYIKESPVVSTGNFRNAFVDDEENNPTLIIELDSIGRERLSAFSKINIGKSMALVIANEIVTIAFLASEMNSSSCAINGGFTILELREMAYKLQQEIRKK